jgi:hypothetical protein
MRPDLKATLLLVAAGLASALFCILFLSMTVYVAGAVFGAVVAICLQKLRIYNERQAGWFVAVATVAYLLSFALAVKLDSAFPPVIYSSRPDMEPPIVWLGGGVFGGFLLIGGALWLLRPKLGGIPLSVRALGGAAWGGILAISGWALGPSLGSMLLKLLEALPLRVADPNAQAFYSILMLWQTGMGLMLGLMLGGRRPQASSMEVEPQ